MTDFKKNIQEYSKSIKTIKEFAKAVQQAPGMYIGSIGNKGFINCCRELLQNATDELQKIDSPCTEVWVEFYEDNHQFVVTDNGRGIPFKDMHRIYAEEHTSSNYVKTAGNYSSGRHGVGAKVTNALSEDFIVLSRICKQYSSTGKPMGLSMKFHEGIAENKSGTPYPNKENFQGTKVSFTPLERIMGKITVTCEEALGLIDIILPLLKIGAIINFKGVKKDGKEINIRRVNEYGIDTYLMNSQFKPVMNPIHLSNDNGTMRADISFTYDANGLDEQDTVYSFANMCPTISAGSTHAQAFVDALSNYFRNYMNKIYLGNKSKITTINSDIRAGLKAVVSVMHLEPIFAGQAKELLSNEDIKPFIKDLVDRGLDEWSRSNANDLQRLCKYFKDVGNLRMKTNSEKIQLTKTAVSVFTGLPSKYQKPSGKKNLELILVEGDSAMSPCREACDPTKQGIMPLRGKVSNAMTRSKKEFFNNEECKAIYTLLDCGEGRRCDVSKCKFDKIIFLGDADVDGLHIRTLLLKMFLVYYRPLVEAGRVYAAVPPLFAIKGSNGEAKEFFTDRSDFIRYVYTKFAKHNVIKSSTGTVLPTSKVVQLLNDNIDYLFNMNVLSQNYAIEPNLLEFLYSLILNQLPIASIKKELKKQYKYLQVREENHILVVDGLANDKVQTAVFNQNMLNDCNERIARFIMRSDPNGYILNDVKVSLYRLMEEFNRYTPKGLQRFKGLGEMDAPELGISALHPEFNRTLIRYTTNDIIKEIEEIRRIDSDKSELLKDIE